MNSSHSLSCSSSSSSSQPAKEKSYSSEPRSYDSNKMLLTLQKKIANNDTLRLIIALSLRLKRLMTEFGDGVDTVSENDMEIESSITSSSSTFPSIFAGKKIPKISIDDYLGRLVYFINKDYQQDDCRIDSVGSRCLIIASIILERFLILNRSTFNFNIKTIHRTFLAAYLVALKTNEDVQLAGDFHARAGGLPKAEMNLLVLEFCKLSNYNFVVEYDTYVQHFRLLLGV